jgi:hypothetical protein
MSEITTICQAAVHLVQNPDLKDFLKHRSPMMGHLCNIPDIYWRSLGSEANKFGAPTHFVDIELLGLKAKDVPTDFHKIITDYTGKKNAFKEGTLFNIPEEFGSLWWRGDQFHRLAVNAGKILKDTAAPKGSAEQQDEKLAYNKAGYDFIISMGVLGHYIGDNSQPFHSTADYDGWAVGHGGIHSYYEEALVTAQDHNLLGKVVEAGLKSQKSKASFLTAANTVEKMKALSELSLQDSKKVLDMDPIKKKSEEKSDKGMKNRTPAEREPADKVAKKFTVLLTTEMGRSAALLANVWDQIYKDAGQPDLKSYRSYKYPITPDFIYPDYFEIKAASPEKK